MDLVLFVAANHKDEGTQYVMERAIPIWELATVDLASASILTKKLHVFFAPMRDKVLMELKSVRHAPRALSL